MCALVRQQQTQCHRRRHRHARRTDGCTHRRNVPLQLSSLFRFPQLVHCQNIQCYELDLISRGSLSQCKKGCKPQLFFTRRPRENYIYYKDLDKKLFDRFTCALVGTEGGPASQIAVLRGHIFCEREIKKNIVDLESSCMFARKRCIINKNNGN